MSECNGSCPGCAQEANKLMIVSTGDAGLQCPTARLEVRATGAVEREVTRYHKLSAELHKVLDELGNRLEPALRPVDCAPTNDSPDKEPHEMVCTVAERVKDHNNALACALERLSGIIARVDL